MWMMGYNDGGELNVPDSFNGRKLRPLIPRPLSSTSNTSSSTSPCLGRFHGTDFFSLNHHLATMADQSKREFNTQPVVVSSRWNPTPEQLRTLEELYRRGTRTPTADQIQHITAQLRRYGKIEGKNVFYWFQNHKARERQKRRRQMESAPDEQEIFERNKESGANRTGYEGEHVKNWAPSTNCSTLSEESVSIPRSAKGAMAAECRADGWTPLDEAELHYRRNFTERNATWHSMQLSCPSPTQLIPTTSNSTSTTATTAITTTATMVKATAPPPPAEATILRSIPKKLIKSHDLNIFISPYKENGYGLINQYYFNNNGINGEELANGCGESQTLQLFPLRSNSDDGNEGIDDKETAATAMNANCTPNNYQFFEFLPLKN